MAGNHKSGHSCEYIEVLYSAKGEAFVIGEQQGEWLFNNRGFQEKLLLFFL
jgi:hypothetical protein